MADKDARVRLNLSASGFATQMQQLRRTAEDLEKAVEEIGGGAEKANRKASGFFTAMKAGATGAKSSLADLGGTMRSVLGQAVTLGGALSIGAAVHSAQAATSSYKDLAFAIRVGTGEAMSWNDVQKDVEVVAGKWKRSNKEIQESYSDLFAETGDASFAIDSTAAVAMAATASGKSVKTLGDIAGTLNEKFGIGAGGIEDALAAALELTNKGGASAEELASKLGLVGASAKLLGMQGSEGFKRVLGMINIADDSTGSMKQKFGAVSNVLEQMADPERLKQIEKALNVKLTDKKGAVRGDALERIIAKTKGDEGELRKAFGATEVKLVASMAKPFVAAFTEAKGSVQQRTAAALDAYKGALDKAGQTTYDADALQQDANARLSDSQRNMTQALNDFEKVFERPEMVRAVDQLAAAAPKVAGVFGNVITAAANHPLLAAGAVVGGVAAKGAVEGVVKKVSDEAMEGAGKLISKAFADQIARDGAWTAAGKAVGVAAAAGIAYQLGKIAIDQGLDDDVRKKEQLQDAVGTAEAMAKHGTGTDDERMKASMALREKIATMEKEGGPNATTKLFGNLANMVDPTVEMPGTTYQRDLIRAKEALAALDQSQRGKPEGGPTIADVIPPPAAAGGKAPGGPSRESSKLAAEVARGDSKVTIANDAVLAAAVARQLGATTLRVSIVGGGSGTNGLPPAAGNGSGSTPR